MGAGHPANPGGHLGWLQGERSAPARLGLGAQSAVEQLVVVAAALGLAYCFADCPEALAAKSAWFWVHCSPYP
jgi:hypothetical protein